MINKNSKIQLITQEGEGQTIEFKKQISKLDREMVAFANAIGGSIFLGIDDSCKVAGIKYTNATISQVQDIAHNCDPSINVKFEKYENVLEILVNEGTDKPYRCQTGFYLRIGPNSQKLSRDEIISFVIGEGKVRFDEQFNKKFNYKNDFSAEDYSNFTKLAKISEKFDPEDVLMNLNVAEKQKGKIFFTNAAILFFTENPQIFFSEAYITAIRYQGNDRTSIIDRKDIRGDLINQVNQAISFCKRHTEEAIEISGNAQHRIVEEYPTVAMREAIINAVTHRDYFYDSSHIYIHIFSDRIEIENPGGLFKGLTIEDLGKRSVRRNRLIAELFFRIGYIEMVGSGITRIYKALEKNGNPAPEIQTTNFFNITFKRRVVSDSSLNITGRQKDLLHFIETSESVTKKECTTYLKVSEDTTLRDIKVLIKYLLVKQVGIGKATKYVIVRKLNRKGV